ncbi:iron-sulfur protein [Corynebacterium sp. HMSC035E02]|uniref:Rieske (2Fe-2S) protein n=1 Tax=Corynebacterium sp. HMSC035E02 TaxID=1715114 RepID=UPI0008A93FEA|nr:Rieske 2Fe-2S domain-containing protein [Corynebacterium sp. HMSC035E02]OHO54859.1 iron-sulfur protein [Corynebacterium sp. HMSC035E02]
MTTCSRRLFLLGTATTFAGAYLAACGKEPTAEIAATDIPVGSAIIVDKVIFAQPTEGEFKAYSQTCPHQGSLITKIEGMTPPCTSHYSSFDLGTGEVTGGPSAKPLTEYGVENDGGTVRNVTA